MIVCVSSDLTLLPLLGVRRKSWYIIIIIYLATIATGTERYTRIIIIAVAVYNNVYRIHQPLTNECTT